MHNNSIVNKYLEGLTLGLLISIIENSIKTQILTKIEDRQFKCLSLILGSERQILRNRKKQSSVLAKTF